MPTRAAEKRLNTHATFDPKLRRGNRSIRTALQSHTAAFWGLTRALSVQFHGRSSSRRVSL